MGWFDRKETAKRGRAAREARLKAPMDAVIALFAQAPGLSLAEKLLGSTGPIAAALPGYQRREGQIELGEAIDSTLRSGGCLAAEAGTGIGKTIAALALGIPFAIEQNAKFDPDILSEADGEPWRPLIYSTAQIALQDQAIFKDLPFLKKHLGIPFEGAYLKGRNHWACNAEIPAAIHPRSTFARWLATDKTGDLSTSPLEIPSHIRERITVEPEDCSTTRCGYYTDCYYFTARQRCRSAHVVILNHALTVVNALSGGAIVGQPCGIIVDEAHKFEEAARGMLSLVIGPDLVHKLIKGPLFAGIIDEDEARACRTAAAGVAREVRDSFNDLRTKTRVLEPTAATALTTKFKTLLKRMTIVHQNLENALGLHGSAEAAHQSLTSVTLLCNTLRALVAGEMENLVAWVEKPTPRSNPEFHVSPLSVASWCRENLWTVPSVLMSATMVSSIDAGFSTITEAVGLPEPATLVATSPYSFREQVRYLLPRWRELTAPPKDADTGRAAKLWADHLAEPMLYMLRITDGRSFVLFTATAAMMEVAERIKATAPAHWTILVQGEGSKGEMIARYKAATNPVLFGLETFWEGVDIPGPLLSAVHIDRIPFPAPGEPVEDALREAVGGFPRSLHRHDIPRACIKLRQAFGRVIRSESCLGLGIIWDPRLRHANYRNTILHALPGWVEPLDSEEISKIPAWLAGTGEAPKYGVTF